MQPANQSVTKERKQALLQEAICDRRAWIYSSSPFLPTANGTTEKDSSNFPALQRFATSKVSNHLPDALQVLEILYGVDGQGVGSELGARLPRSVMDESMLDQVRAILIHLAYTKLTSQFSLFSS